MPRRQPDLTKVHKLLKESRVPTSKPTASKPTVGAEAEEIIHGERAKMYGHPKKNFVRIALGWTGYLHGRGPIDADNPLTAHDVAELMIILKAVRGSEGYHRDSAIDTIGYAALTAILAEDDEY